MSTASVTHLDEATFDRSVSDSNVPVLVAFLATWSGPCRMIAPVLDEIAKEQGNAVRIVKVDVDNNPALSKSFRDPEYSHDVIFQRRRGQRPGCRANK